MANCEGVSGFYVETSFYLGADIGGESRSWLSGGGRDAAGEAGALTELFFDAQ